MKKGSEIRNLEKYSNEIKNKTDRELLEEKAYFTFATYRTTENIHTILYIWSCLIIIGIAITLFNTLLS